MFSRENKRPNKPQKQKMRLVPENTRSYKEYLSFSNTSFFRRVAKVYWRNRVIAPCSSSFSCVWDHYSTLPVQAVTMRSQPFADFFYAVFFRTVCCITLISSFAKNGLVTYPFAPMFNPFKTSFSSAKAVRKIKGILCMTASFLTIDRIL